MKPGGVQFILKCSEAHFSAAELKSLKENGHQLQSLAKLQMPLTDEEEAFLVNVREIYDRKSTGNLQSLKQEKFKVFLKYLEVLSKEGNLFEINNQKMTQKKKSMLENRVTPGGLRTDDQENRFE